MADDINDKATEGLEKEEPSRGKKKSKKGLVFLLLLLSIMGGLGGLVLSGLWDARPLFYYTVPRIPYIGKDLASFLDVPKVYTLSLEERRHYELNLWQDDLIKREEGLKKLSSSLDNLSRDLALKATSLKSLEKSLEAKEPSKEDREELSKEEKEVFERVVRTYQEISARRAAKIVENLTPSLAVRILNSLPEEDGAKILGRMEAAKAAWLTEQLTKSRQ